jgi:hypothetical protein
MIACGRVYLYSCHQGCPPLRVRCVCDMHRWTNDGSPERAHVTLCVQVPLLLKMKAGENALEKALLSGDNDLVYLAVLHLRRV